MRKGKPFFYRIEASDFFAETLKFKSDKDLGKFIRQFSIDLVTGLASTPYSSRVITEAVDYIDKKRQAGKKGGEQKASSAKASLGDCSSTGLASSSNSNSTETKEDKPLDPPPAEADPVKPAEVVPPFSKPVMWLSEELARLILVNNPKNRELQEGKLDATVLRWAKDIDKMIRLDHREPREVAEVVRWCQKDSFWSQNILSGLKLREQYDKLILKMKGTVLAVVPAKPAKETRLDRNVQAVIDAGKMLGVFDGDE